MLFNSYEFIFAFLPVCLGVFFFLGSMARGARGTWLARSVLAIFLRLVEPCVPGAHCFIDDV